MSGQKQMMVRCALRQRTLREGCDRIFCLFKLVYGYYKNPV
ncbi:hypothetical protein [Scytonema sp. PCC 10023]